MPADQLIAAPADLHRQESSWEQVNIEFTDWPAAPALVENHLQPVLTTTSDGWWYIRKHPHWRVRHTAGPCGNALRSALDELVDTDAVRTWHPAIYEPEVLALGGPAGMHVAHDLFCRDSPTTLHLLATPRHRVREPGRTELSLLAISRMLRAAGLDWYEQGDVWARVAESRSGIPPTRPAEQAAPAVRRLLTLDTGPDTPLVAAGPLAAHRTWLDAFDDAGTQLGALARTGHLTRGLRAVLAHHVIFHWNRLALPSPDQHLLAVLARDALLPAEDTAP